MSLNSADTATLIRELADRTALEDLVARHSVWIDEARWDQTDRLFTDDILTSSLRGEAHGIEALIALVNQGHDTIARSLHNKTNIVIDLDGDTAAVRAHDIGVFVYDDKTEAIAAGIHHYRARRTEDGWRFDRLRVEPVALTTALDRAV